MGSSKCLLATGVVWSLTSGILWSRPREQSTGALVQDRERGSTVGAPSGNRLELSRGERKPERFAHRAAFELDPKTVCLLMEREGALQAEGWKDQHLHRPWGVREA